MTTPLTQYVMSEYLFLLLMRRRKEVITVKSLEQLTAALNHEEYGVKGSFIFIHLLTRNSTTIDGKKHVKMLNEVDEATKLKSCCPHIYKICQIKYKGS